MKSITMICLSLTLALGLFSFPVYAEAYIPAENSELLERLPVSASERNRLERLKQDLSNNHKNINLVLQLARNYISTGRNLSDPRYYSYAEAVLTPWVKNGAKNGMADPEVLVLMATILQNRHDFTAALDLLKTALAINPRHLQAWLTKAAIHEAQGDYPSALRSCLGLAKLSASLSAAVCLNSALSLSGQAQYGYDQLRLVLAGNEANPEQLTWAYAILAEIAERLDKPKDAEDWYRKALSTGYRSVYLLTAYADFLLAHERPLEVQKLLHNEPSIDALLLRLTLAEQRLQHPDYQMHVEIIKTRMAAAKARGDNVHQGDEARFALQVLKDAETALILARANWSVQKEPRDARLLLETAVAANAPDAAKPVLEFIAQSRLEDKRLQGLVGLAKGDLL